MTRRLGKIALPAGDARLHKRRDCTACLLDPQQRFVELGTFEALAVGMAAGLGPQSPGNRGDFRQHLFDLDELGLGQRSIRGRWARTSIAR